MDRLPPPPLPFMAQARSVRALKTRKEKQRGPVITCGTDRTNDANQMLIIWLLLIIPGKERNNLTF